MSLTIVITTHKREPSYLEATLKSYHETCDHSVEVLYHELYDPAEEERLLALGVEGCDFLSEEQNTEKLSLGLRVRSTHATRLALEMADDECILLQDDVKFSPGWLGVLADHLASIEDRDNALVALYAHRPSDVEGLVRWDPKTYWGLQGMFFGKAARLATIEKAFQTSGALRLWPNENNASSPSDDVRLQRFLLDNPGYPLYTIYPSLIQHIGMISSVDPSRFMKQSNPEPHVPVRWPTSTLKRSR